MAKGILMERHDLDPVQAFRLLVESSHTTNMKLHQIATWLTEHSGPSARRATRRPAV